MTLLLDFALPESPPRLVRHKAGDHSLCNPDSPGHGTCSQCGKTVQVGRSSAPPELRRCKDCRSKIPLRSLSPRACELCECTYTPKYHPRPGERQRFCSKSCAQAWRNGARPPYVKGPAARATRNLALARTRRLRHAQTWDGITDEEILERDGWRCQIPGCKWRPIRRDLKYPHPRSKSIDHIVPLSFGGDDTAENKRAAHLGCNVARGNKMGEEQVALFGSIREPPLATVTAGERAVILQRKHRNQGICPCGAVSLRGRKFCQSCADWRAAEAERRRTWMPSIPIYYYTCRYCGDLKVARRTRTQPQKACSARACQLARIWSNNLRVRQGISQKDADALVTELMASASGPGCGRWQRGTA